MVPRPKNGSFETPLRVEHWTRRDPDEGLYFVTPDGKYSESLEPPC